MLHLIAVALLGQAITLQVHNYAEVPSGILTQAKTEASQTFRQIDIDVQWTECTLLGDGETDCSESSEAVTGAGLSFKIRILKKSLYSNGGSTTVPNNHRRLNWSAGLEKK